MNATRQIELAARAYAKFHGSAPEWLDKMEIAGAGFRVGTLFGVTYGVVEKGREVVYHHDFIRPPCLASTFDGRMALILTGEWRFSRRGFVG